MKLSRGHHAFSSFVAGLSIVAGLLLSSGAAVAGPNADGVLIVSYHDVITYSDGDPESVCQLIEEFDPLLDCGGAVTNVLTDPPGRAVLWAVYAAFPLQSSPRLAGVTVGVDYDNSTVFLVPGAWESCGDFVLHDNDWPGPNTGAAITWNAARTDHLVRVLVFAGYEYYGQDTSFDLIPHPNGGGFFADDDVPSNLDEIADYGRLGFNGDPGYLPCPVDDPLGACCLPDCSCVVTTRDECSSQGEWMGPDTACDPNQCPCPEQGACCFDDGTCSLRSEPSCIDAGGTYLGQFTDCDPNPCEVVPVFDSSWGRIKGTYR